jgi:hypothetical protein
MEWALTEASEKSAVNPGIAISNLLYTELDDLFPSFWLQVACQTDSVYP